MARVRFLGLVCLFVWCSAAFGEDEDFERVLEMYRQNGSVNMEQRLREYEALQEMRRARGERHLPAGSQFDFARESFRIRSEAPGVKDANGCAWTSAGPTNLNGRVTSIAIDPTNRDNIYAATVGGLWRSSTAGRRWQRVSDDFLATVFGAIAVNPGAPNEILAGGGDSNFYVWNGGNGMWRSTNFGAPGSWSKVTNQFDMQVVYRIRYDPAPPHDIYVAATNGVWIGKHLTGFGGGIMFTPLGGFDAATHDIVVDFSQDPRVVYAGVRENSPTKPAEWRVGIHKWDGMDWYTSDNGIDLTDAETFSLAMAESNPSVIYAKVSERTDDTLVGIYKTTTGGMPVGFGKDAKPGWKKLPSAVWWEDAEELGAVPDDTMARYNRMLEVDPTDPNRVFAGSINMWMSTDGGNFWENVSWGRDPAYHFQAHPDFHTLAFDPENPNIIYVGNDAGIDRSTDMSQSVWHWQDVAHGMTVSQFYTLTSNRLYPTLLAGGMQDNGTNITFGNRVWYPPGGCDGADVGSDAENPDTLYANCNGGLSEIVNPVPGTLGGATPTTYDTGAKVSWNFPMGMPPIPPVITDAVTPMAALAGGGELCGMKTILKTTDGVNWTETSTTFSLGGAAVELASAPSSGFMTYLAAVAYTPFDQKKCPGVMSVGLQPEVIRSDTGGGNWFPTLGLPAGEVPTSVAFDPYDKFRSYVTYGGGKRIYMSKNGVSYLPINGSGSTELKAFVRRVVADPFDKNVLYAATTVGMFRGVVTPSALPTAVWAPFNEGLPDGMDIMDLWVDPATGILTIGSFGFGAFRRDIRATSHCEKRMLVVRDCVYDIGRETSPCNVPDPEHPIPDDARPGGFFKPDDTKAGKAWWWTSRDIRVDVPSKNPPANQIEDADSVEFEICPTSVSNCLPGAMIDSAPEALKPARVYVQVTNRGVEPVSKTRVIALWSPSASAFEPLPDTFWTKTFAANGKCSDLDPGTAWHLVDPAEPCRTIATITPDYPELARFDWYKVPTAAAEKGAAFLTIVESAEDPIDPSIREKNKLDPDEIVPGSRHIALRNLNIKPFKFREIHMRLFWPLEIIKLPQDPLSEVEIVVSKVDLREAVQIALPHGLTAHAGEGNVRRTRITDPDLLRKLDEMHLDPENAWEFTGDEASLYIDLRDGERITTGMMAMPPETGTASRVSIVQRSRGRVVGGSVMLLRPEM